MSHDDPGYADTGCCSGCGKPMGSRGGIGAAQCWDCRNGAVAPALDELARTERGDVE